MNISEIVRNSFILIQGGWPAARSLDLIRNLKATHVIAHCRGPRDTYLLFTKSEALNLLERHAAVDTPTEALLSKDSHVTPLLESGNGAVDASRRVVVVEDDRVVGFIDPAYRPRIKREGGRGQAHNDADREKPADVVALSLAAELPEEVALGEATSLLVHLNADPTTAPAMPLNLRRGTKVDVVIKARRGFTLEGRGEGCLIVSGDEEMLPIQFKVKGVSLGRGLIRVFAFQQGQPLGSVTLTPTVVEAGGRTNDRPLKSDRPLRPAGANLPDLSLVIFEETVNGAPALSLWLTTADPDLGLNLKEYGPVRLRAAPLRYFREFFQDVENLPAVGPQQQAVLMARLAAKGSHLFMSVIPKEMREEIWRLRASITSVQVQSQEPWVPWELCKMFGEENGRVTEGPFFCEAFNITRWLPGVSRRPSLSLKNLALVVPRNSGLAYAPAERKYMLSLGGADRKVTQIPATYLDVRSALAGGEYDGLHFSGHGIRHDDEPNRSQIILEDGSELTPEDLSGVVGNLGLRKPVVFLNACQSGRTGTSLTDIGGWAKQFLHAGAGVFVGAYWSIYDQSAYEFTRAFYDRLLAGKPVGEVTREAREAIRLSGDPTWLAYTVFADPLAVLRGAP